VVSTHTPDMSLVHPREDLFAFRTFRDEVADLDEVIGIRIIRELLHQPAKPGQWRDAGCENAYSRGSNDPWMSPMKMVRPLV